MATESASPRRFTFTIGTLLFLMLWVALACNALRTPTDFWAGATFAVTLFALFMSVVVIIYRDKSARAFAVGFLVFGGGYLACVSLLDGLSVDGPGGEKMITSRGVGWLYGKLQSGNVRTVVAGSGSFGGMGGMGSGMGAGTPPATFKVNIYPYSHFHAAAQSALAIIIGLTGGIITQLLYVTKRE